MPERDNPEDSGYLTPSISLLRKSEGPTPKEIFAMSPVHQDDESMSPRERVADVLRGTVAASGFAPGSEEDRYLRLLVARVDDRVSEAERAKAIVRARAVLKAAGLAATVDERAAINRGRTGLMWVEAYIAIDVISTDATGGDPA